VRAGAYVFRANWHQVPALEALYQALTDFMNQPVLEDDVTAIIIKVA
jgi:hypothetical protein